jgi:Amt family ammonium transporter
MHAINSGDTAFVLISAALVMFMTPGLALFYGGMVRSKNILSTLMHSFIALGIVSIIWTLIGYTLAFGPDKWHLIGGLNFIGLKGIGQLPIKEYAPTIPGLAFVVYQGMFAVITPALISGAFAERIKFKAYVIFIAAWSILIYAPVAHWVWGTGGWIRQLGALDFAGGTVVHISSGIAALITVIIIGKRKGFPEHSTQPHNIPITLIGTAILWFGWFGFNAGSALSSGGLASIAFVATNLGAAGACLSWTLIEWIRDGKPTMLGAASGAVAGLVAITPAAGFVGPVSAIVIGLLGGAFCYFAISLKHRFGYDDALDVVGVHFAGGTLGALATGFFASKIINPGGNNGLFFGNASLLGIQAIAVLSVIAYSAVMTFIIFKAIDLIMGVRVSEKSEYDGLDISEHGEIAVFFDDSGSEPVVVGIPDLPGTSEPIIHAKENTNEPSVSYNGKSMKRIVAIIQPHKLNAVKDALINIDIQGITVSEVRGFGKQKGYTEIYRGTKFIPQFITKVRLEIILNSKDVNKAKEVIINSARTGEIGDGKIFISPVDETVRIRTGEKDLTAV